MNSLIDILKEGRDDQVAIRFRIFMAKGKEVKIPDVLTDIRALKGITTVRQVSPVLRSKKGRDVIDIELKYIPEIAHHEEYLYVIGKLIKSVANIDIIKILSLGGREVLSKEGKYLVF